MDKQKVKEAMELIEKAKRDDEFLEWLKERMGELDADYEVYKDMCYDSGEEPDDFYTWALWQYVNEGGENDAC